MTPENCPIIDNSVETTLPDQLYSSAKEKIEIAYVTVRPSIWINVPKIIKKLSPMFNIDQIEIEYSK